MSLHDFWCQRCGQVLTDVNVPIEIGARNGAPEHCGQQTAWIPGGTAMDVGGVKGASFKSFTTYDGQNRPVRVESFAQMRKLERASEQDARNGEGQPIRFRHLHQDRSNHDRNTFGEAPQEKPTEAMIRKYRPTLTDADGPDLGPAVHDGNVSAVKDS